jgi:hypothetical protein
MDCVVQTDSGQIVECEVLTGSGQTVEDSSGHSDTEPTDGTVCGTDRQWADCTKFVTNCLLKITQILATGAASCKHELVRIVTENISAILCSTSTSQQQFLLFSFISHKQL